MPVSYTVIATLPDQATRDEYVAWLLGGHVRAVKRGGATEAVVVQVDEPAEPIRVESRYVFPTPEAFRAYVDHHAPLLRGDGLSRFGGRVGFERRVGTVLVGPGADA